jgi:pSer/pThr/pTyr-binding forkhead associated (FHA) protein
MIELWLKFTDEKGEAKRVLVEREKFAVGRHSENDLSVASGKLSREHLKIERFGDVFVASDSGSSNGTTVNGADLNEPVSLKNGDVLNLGGGLEIEIELVSDDPNANNSSENAVEDSEENSQDVTASAGSQSVSTASGGGSIPTVFLFLAPVFGLVVLLVAGGIFFAFRGTGTPEIAESNNNFIYPTTDRNGKTNKNENGSNADKTPTKSQTPANSIENTTQTPAPVSGETERVKHNAAEFMRRMAKGDANPFLTSEQAEKVGEKIKSFKDSNAFVEQLKAVKKDSAQFESMASSKDLKPQFLAAAALTKSVNGNPTETARSMLPVLNELKIALDNKLANDNLLIIAAFERGAAGKPRDLRNTIEALAKKSQNVSPREIRTIWFLRENDKITDAEFDAALRFLAIGAIMQNPKDFDINIEAVIF